MSNTKNIFQYIVLLCLLLSFQCTKESTTANTNPSELVPQVYAGRDSTVYILDTITLNGILLNDVKAYRATWYKQEGSNLITIDTGLIVKTVAPPIADTTVYICDIINSKGESGKDSVVIYTRYDNSFTAYAGKDTTVHTSDTLNLKGIYSSLFPLLNTYWSIGVNTPFVKSSLDTTFIVPSTAQTLQCILKLENVKYQTVYDTVIIQVLQGNLLTVNAGKDTIVHINSPLQLRGVCTGENNTWWKIGNGNFIQSPPETLITVSPHPENLYCILKAQNTLGHIRSDTLLVKVIDTLQFSVDAGHDTTVLTGNQVTLSAQVFGEQIDSSWWKIGTSGQFLPGALQHSFTTPTSPIVLLCVFKAKSISGKYDMDTVVVTVIEEMIGQSPIAHGGNDTIVRPNDLINLHGTGTDSDGTIIKYEWKFGTNPWIVVSNGDTTITAPPTEQLYRCLFRVTDNNGLTGLDTVNITVQGLIPPVADAGNDTIVGLYDTIKLHGRGTDSDGFIVKYEWKISSRPWAETSTSDTIYITSGWSETRVCKFRVTDNDGLTAMDSITITSKRVYPKAIAGKSAIVKRNEIVNLYGTGTDSDGSIIKHEWKIGDGDWVESITGDTTITVPSTKQVYLCLFRVTDDDTLRNVDTVKLFVEEVSGMKLIPAKNRSFKMGSDEGDPDELPIHTVQFTQNFYMDSTEVTQEEYSDLMSATYADYKEPDWSYKYCNKPDCPAYDVSWYEAVLYCNARSKRDGLDTAYSYTSTSGEFGEGYDLLGFSVDFHAKGYRLPTEAEWEFACRAGTTSKYFWGTQGIQRYAWHWDLYKKEASPVAGKWPNEFRLYDMSGNLWEYCHDWYGDYSADTLTDPTGPATGTHRVIRGGCWDDYGVHLRSASRNKGAMQWGSFNRGFRVVIAAP